MCGGPVRLEDYYSTGGAPRMCASCELHTWMMQEEAAWAGKMANAWRFNQRPPAEAEAMQVLQHFRDYEQSLTKRRADGTPLPCTFLTLPEGVPSLAARKSELMVQWRASQTPTAAVATFEEASKKGLPCHHCGSTFASQNWAWHMRQPPGKHGHGRCADDKLCTLHRAYVVAARAARAAASGQPYPQCPCADRVVGFAPCSKGRFSGRLSAIVGSAPSLHYDY